MKEATIYCAINSISGSVYVGRTVLGMQKRKHQHINSCKNARSPFHIAINKYGIESFGWHELYFCSEKDSQAAETFFINEFKEDGYCLYNLGDGSFGGDTLTGHPRREEIISKMKHSNIIAQNDPEQKEKMRSIAIEKQYGKWMQGKKLSDQHKENISKGIQAAMQDENKRAKISGKGKSRRFSEEHKLNLSKSSKGNAKSQKHRDALSASLKGRKLSAEHIRKIKEGLERRRCANLSPTS